MAVPKPRLRLAPTPSETPRRVLSRATWTRTRTRQRRRKPKLKAAGRDAQVGDTVFWNHFTLGESECDRPEDSSIEGGSGVVTECMDEYVMAKRISIPMGRVAKRIPRIEITGRTPKDAPAAADVFSPGTQRPAKRAAKNALTSPAADAAPSSPPKKHLLR